MGVLEILFLIFLVLKLIGGNPVADWSWWWVTAPLWGAAVAWVFMVLSFLGLGAVASKVLR